MKNKPILITGCQRSGTTLLHLILDSHPEVHGVDEVYYWEREFEEYLTEPAFHPRVEFKLPRFVAEFDWMRKLLPELKVIWCVRDPRDVLASMLALPCPMGEAPPVSWCSHPRGAVIEFENCLPVLNDELTKELTPYLEQYHAIQGKAPHDRTRQEDVLVGALCWRIKNEILGMYDGEGIPYYLIHYEQLTTNPRDDVGKLLPYLELTWHDDVLRHHDLHSGIHIGATDFSRAIDTAKIGRWQKDLSQEELDVVRELNADLAKKFGYDIVG